jgi:hypothetical protein
VGYKSGADDLLRENLQLDVADEWDAAPCYWSGPEGSTVGNSALDSGEVGMG